MTMNFGNTTFKFYIRMYMHFKIKYFKILFNENLNT